MIRFIQYRIDGTGEWVDGIVHGFNDGNCIVEKKDTGELLLVPVKPECLKFKILTEAWVAMQVEAQRQAQASSVLAGPIPRDFRGR